MMYLQVLAGFVLLLGGAEIMVRGAIGLADRLGISKMVIGMTVVAFGTSAPELLVSLNAALSGSAGLALGNVIGSNIANIWLVLGAAGLLLPIACAPGALIRDGYILLAGTGAFLALAMTGLIGLVQGLILVVLFAGFLAYSFWREKFSNDEAAQVHIHEAEEYEAVPQSIGLAAVLLIVGFGGLFLGSEWLVEGGVAIARSFGVSEAVIGLTIIAFGTSLPELAASVVAALRRHADVALGNVVGSNIFNIVGIVGIVAIVAPLEVPVRVMQFDIWIMVVATLALMPFMIGRRLTLGRIDAAIYLVLYVAYITALGLGVDSLVPA